MLAGFIQRFSSIAESGSQDISLLSRVYEARGALSDFAFNPIIGHGPGTEFTFWNIINHGTQTSNFIHNGYVSLLFKHGVLGFVLVLTAWIGSVVAGLRAFHARSATGITRAVGLAAAAALIGFLLSSLAAPLFTLDDTTFNVAVLMGLACGSHARATREEAT
jgi:O-antigen ligase